MGKRRDAVTINGKQYLQKEEVVSVDLEGSLDGVIGQLNDLRDQYGGDAQISIQAETDVDPYSGWCEAELTQQLIYTRVETDDERCSRLERNKKQREQRRKHEQERKKRELQHLQRLAEKHGKKVV